MKFKKVTIIGVGLLGGSFALSLRKQFEIEEIVGVSSRLSSAEKAKHLGVIDVASDDVKQSVRSADLILIATPMLSMDAILEQIVDVVPSHCLITDVGSVKGILVDLVEKKYAKLLPQFVFAHPIAGGEKSGASAATSDLFDQKHLILVETQAANEEFVHCCAEIWESFGSKVVKMTAKEHDAVFAYTSHLPHVVAYALVNNLHQHENRQELFQFASAGFYDFTRIASSDPVMWRDICISNKQEVLDSLKQFSSQLTRLQAAIENDDFTGLEEMFDDAKQARDEGLIKKQS